MDLFFQIPIIGNVVHKIESSTLVEFRVKTTPENVNESNEGLFHNKMNLPAAAKHCGMTQKEMKMVFWEYLKNHPPTYDNTGS